MKTLYDKLGVTRHASYAEIDQNYRHSLNEHIAGNRNRPLRKKDQLRLQQIRQAYLTLSSPIRRLDYDLKLDQLEHARLRKIERVGTGIGLVLLVAGLALIAHGYYRQVHAVESEVQVVQHVIPDAHAQLESTILASKGQSISVPVKAAAD